MNSSVRKHSIIVGDHRTSVSLEDAFWNALKQIAAHRSMTLSELATVIDAERGPGNLSSRLRLYVLNFYQDLLFEGQRSGVVPGWTARTRRASSD
ncbi:MAG TPA: ribbon-helix-helix domain-containing protein [Xanthobacteraceae bacterium]|jgi:predicted DNA-binding ribbon-helix-helix protein